MVKVRVFNKLNGECFESISECASQYGKAPNTIKNWIKKKEVVLVERNFNPEKIKLSYSPLSSEDVILTDTSNGTNLLILESEQENNTNYTIKENVEENDAFISKKISQINSSKRLQKHLKRYSRLIAFKDKQKREIKDLKSQNKKISSKLKELIAIVGKLYSLSSTLDDKFADIQSLIEDFSYLRK